MAEYLSIQEVKNYALSNGTTVDLVAMIGTGTPEGWVRPEGLGDLHIGQVAYVGAMGAMRRGVVTKLGRTKVMVSFTTQGSVDESYRFYQGAKGVRVQGTSADATQIRIAPAETMDEAIERVTARQVPAEAPAELSATEAQERDYEADDHTVGDYSAPAETEWTVAGQVEESDRYEDELAEDDYPTKGEIHEFEAAEAAEYLAEDEEATPVTLPLATGSAVVAALETMWTAIRANHPELPEVVMVTGSGIAANAGPGKWGHHWADGWTERNHEVQAEGETKARKIGELFIAGEAIAKGARQVLQTMLHEAAHALAKARNVQDTSRQNRWHNQTFRRLAEEMGLEYPQDRADPSLGFSAMVLTPGTEEEYAPVIENLDRSVALMIDLPDFLRSILGTEGGDGGGEHISRGKRTGGEAKATNYVKAVCGCRDEKGRPEFVIRMAKTKLAKASIRCMECNQDFNPAESEDSGEEQE